MLRSRHGDLGVRIEAQRKEFQRTEHVAGQLAKKPYLSHSDSVDWNAIYEHLRSRLERHQLKDKTKKLKPQEQLVSQIC